MEFLKKYRFDLLVLGVVILIPIFTWATMRPLTSRFDSVMMILTSIGQLTALLGTVLVAISMIFQIKLCRYFRFLSKPTTGLNIHHYTGFWGLLLLMVHPLVLAARMLPTSLQSAFSFLYTTQLTNLIGLVAMIVMILSMYTALFLERSFRFWKLLHQIMLVAYLGILYHTIFVYSDTSNSAFLKGYLLGLLLLGGIMFSIQKIQGYLWPKATRNEDSC